MNWSLKSIISQGEIKENEPLKIMASESLDSTKYVTYSPYMYLYSFK